MSASVFDVVGQTFDIIKENPIVVLPYLAFIVAIIILVIIFIIAIISQVASSSLLHSFITSMGTTPPSLSTMTTIAQRIISILPAVILLLIIIGLISIFLAGMYVSLAKQFYTKQKISLENAFNEAKSRYLSLLGATIGAGLMFLVLIAIFGVLVLAASSSTVALVLMILILVIACVALGILLFQISTAVIVEGRPAIDAIQRSIEIGKANMGTIFGLIVVFIVLDILLELFSLIPILGILIRLVGGIILSIMAYFIGPAFYYNYISKRKTTSGKKPKKR
jgi:hypothetical protein